MEKKFEKIQDHPATETNVEIKKQEIKYNEPINITLNYNIKPQKDQFLVQRCTKPCPSEYVTGTVTNRFITTGYGASTTLGSGPVDLVYTNEATMPRCEYALNPAYRRVAIPFGSTDNAKMSKNMLKTLPKKSNMFDDSTMDCYTLLK